MQELIHDGRKLRRQLFPHLLARVFGGDGLADLEQAVNRDPAPVKQVLTLEIETLQLFFRIIDQIGQGNPVRFGD